MKHKNSLFILLSAALYGLPFLYSTHIWWLILLFPIPLFYVAATAQISFLYGLMWGLSAFIIHGIGHISVMTRMAHQWWLLGAAIGICIILYYALSIGTLFWIAHQYTFKNTYLKLLIYSGLLWLIVTWIDRYSLWIFGIKEGYPLIHPLLLLANYPSLLWLLPFLGKTVLTGLFISLSTTVVAVLLYPNKYTALSTVLALSPWIMSFLCNNTHNNISNTAYTEHIIALPSINHCTSNYPISSIKIIGNTFRHILEEYPQTICIIMPESALTFCDFEKIPELLALWGAENVGKPINVIFGAGFTHNNKQYNSLYWIFDGKLQCRFDKRHTMLLSERLPAFLNCPVLHTMYRSNGCCEVSCSTNNRIAIHIPEIGTCIPYICSELFCNENPDDQYGNQTIIALVNDSVFWEHYCSIYIAQLLILLAQLKAIMWRRDILYIAYGNALLIKAHPKALSLIRPELVKILG